MADKVVGFTGTRSGLTKEQIFELSRIFVEHSDEYGIFIHGDCVGADAEADNIAYSVGYRIKMRPCNLKYQRAFCKNGINIAEPIAPLERNRHIVDDSDIMIGCPKGMEEERRSGTWATIRYSIKRKKKIIIIYPDGTLEVKNETK